MLLNEQYAMDTLYIDNDNDDYNNDNKTCLDI